jgi:FkbM family methyltransferase
VAENRDENYYQGTEYKLAHDLLSRLDNRKVVDVGAEKGGFVEACLAAGAEHVYAFEPYPPHVEHLRRKFGAASAVTVFDIAIADREGSATLHIAHDAAGEPMDYHHSLLGSLNADDVEWHREIDVPCRSLGSLVRDHTIPGEVGLLKIDTEGGDLLALQGMGTLESAIVMVEYCRNPGYAGDSPYEVSDVARLLDPRGYRDLAFVKRNDGFEVIQIGTENARLGDWGNLVLIHERVRARLMPMVYDAAASRVDALMDHARTLRRGYVRAPVRIPAAQEGTREAAPAPQPWIGAAPPGERDRLQSGFAKISIVTPSFNQARFLEQTMKSVLEQDYPHVEYIVIDGGSSDESVELIKRYADRLAYWISERDRGQTDALNKGFAKATGDIVAWVNSDDFYYPGAFREAAAAFAANPDLGLVYGRGNRVTVSGEIICEFEATRPFDLEALVYGVDYILQPTTFMRRQALHEVGPFDPRLHYAFDWELWMRLGERFPARMLDSFVAAGREYPAAKTFTGGFPRAEEIRRIVSRHTGNEVSLGYLAYYLHTLIPAMASARLLYPRLREGITALTGVCQELLNEDRLREGASGRRSAHETAAYADGWVGSELRLWRTVPLTASHLRLRGTHVDTVASVMGPLVLEARLDDQPLGTGVVLRPGPFSLCWHLPPAERNRSGNPARDSRLVVINANALSGWKLGHPDEPRLLSFMFHELTIENTVPQGSQIASRTTNGAADEAFRTYQEEYEPTTPHADGWAGPQLYFEVSNDAAAEFLCISGIHDPEIARLIGRLTLTASLNGEHLGTGVIQTPGPFVLCWALPGPMLEKVRARDSDRPCEIIVASPVAVVPERFWPSADRRKLAFRFVDLSFHPSRPPGSRMAPPKRTVTKRLRRSVAGIARRMRFLSRLSVAIASRGTGSGF